MRNASDARPDDDLDLPPLDGEEDVEATEAHEELDESADAGDPLDDATGEGDPIDEVVADGGENGWLVDAEEAGALDVGPFDVVVASVAGDEDRLDDDDEPDPRAYDELVAAGDESVIADAGEEGPLDADEELREGDLPALDADEDGEVEDDALYDRAMLDGKEDLRWDDRAWERVAAAADLGGALAVDASDDSGLLAVPGEDPAQRARDATWRRLEEEGSVTAAAFVPGGSVVVAFLAAHEERSLLVRISPDGAARIIGEIEAAGAGAEDDDAAARSVTTLKWDAPRGWLVAHGAFGVQAFRPA